jgi:hypothetical protein
LTNYEIETIFNLIASAQDSGGTEQSQEIPVSVVDINEAPSEILITDAQLEEGQLGSFIGSLSVLDPDKNDTHSFSLSSMKDGELFELVGNQLKLKEGVIAVYDSSKPYYSLYITVTDSEGLKRSQWFSVLVNQVNEDSVDKTYNGSAFSDLIIGFSSFNLINGGEGTDSVVYPLPTDAVRFTLDHEGRLNVELVLEPLSWDNSGNTNVSINAFVAIERLVFVDKSYALDILGDAGELAKIIISAFGLGRFTDFLTEGLRLLERDLSVEELSTFVVDNYLMESVHGVENDVDFVETVFKNVVGRLPETAELNFYTSYLENVLYTRANFLDFATNTDLVAEQMNGQAIDLVGNSGSLDGQFWAFTYNSG